VKTLFWITVLVALGALGGCATTYEELTAEKNVCEANLQIPEIREAVKRCEAKGDTGEACRLRTPEPDNDVCWERIWQRDDAIARREEKRQADHYCSERGLAEFCNGKKCGCVTRSELRWMLRRMQRGY